jgi:hypothetical protein
MSHQQTQCWAIIKSPLPLLSFSYANVDYAIAGALENTEDIKIIKGIYDIGCHYGVHFLNRMSARFPWLRKIVSRMKFLVGKMHLLGHLEICQYLFSLNYTIGSGRVEGEAAERGFAASNLNAGSTREMNAGHRHDVLNDHHSYHNLRKLTSMSASSIFVSILQRHLTWIERQVPPEEVPGSCQRIRGSAGRL